MAIGDEQDFGPKTLEAYASEGALPWQRQIGGQYVSDVGALDRYYNRSVADLEKSLADQEAAALAANAQARASLDRYIAQRQAYGQNRRNAILGAYGNLTQSTVGRGADVAQRGSDLAREIEQLYSQLAATNAETYANANMGAPGMEVGGLAPISGEAAAMMQTIPATGSNLADYLQSAAGIDASSMYDLGRAQGEQGIAYAQNYIDRLNAALAEERYRAEREAAARLGAVGSARSNALAQLNALRNQMLYEQELTRGTEAAKAVQGIRDLRGLVGGAFEGGFVSDTEKLAKRLGIQDEYNEAKDQLGEDAANNYVKQTFRSFAVENPGAANALLQQVAPGVFGLTNEG